MSNLLPPNDFGRASPRGSDLLSDDEYVVLMIASEGESMMPLGRWEHPVESLVAKGYLRALDRFNNIITTEGRKALGRREADDIKALKLAAETVSDLHTVARAAVEASAKALAHAAQASVQATGDSLQTAVLMWNTQVLRRAMEIVSE